MRQIVEYKCGRKWLLLMQHHADKKAAEDYAKAHFRDAKPMPRIRVKPISDL